MTLTPEQANRIETLLRLSWSFEVSRNEEEGYLIARVKELPSVLATGETEEELGTEIWDAMRAALSAYVLDGDEIPMPPGSDRRRASQADGVAFVTIPEESTVTASSSLLELPTAA
jgi:predicted RNase H-like HicB family nuclease